MGRLAKPLQTSFTSGELDPLLGSRIDVRHYYNGADRLRNVLVIPQGGVRRRPGLEFVAEGTMALDTISAGTVTAPNNGTTANLTDGNISTNFTTSSAGTTSNFTVWHADMGSNQTVFAVDQEKVYLSTGTSASEFKVQYSLNNSTWTDLGDPYLSVGVVADAIWRRRWGPVSARYLRFIRVGATSIGTVSVCNLKIWKESTSLSNFRLIPFAYSTEQRFMCVASDRSLAVFKDTTLQAHVAIPHTSAQLPYVNWVQSLDTLFLFHEDVATFQVQRQGADDEWDGQPASFANIPQYDFGAGNESTWSDTRGWPRCGTFHEGRLWLGGTAERPSTIWASKAGDLFSFDLGTAQADEAIEVTLDTDAVASIVNVYSGRHLQVFTTSAEFFVLPDGDPITPENIVVKRTTEIGSKGPGQRVHSVEGATLFLQQGGKSFQEFLFTDTEQAYSSKNISLLSSHLIIDPVDVAVRKATSTDEGDLLLVVNTDGSLATLTTLRSQEITAWTLQETQGSFLAVGCDASTMWLVVEREVNNATVRYLEIFNEDLYLDAASLASAAASNATLAHLPNTTVGIVLDGAAQSDGTTNGTGLVAFDRASVTSWQVGLRFPDVKGAGDDDEIWVRSMPIDPRFQDGSAIGRKGRVYGATLRIFESGDLWFGANGQDPQLVSLRTFGSITLDAAPPIVTGERRIAGLTGFSVEKQFEVTQRAPQPLTLLAVLARISI